MAQSFFIASTGQNVGKTTTCLGLVSGLKRHQSVGFIKPIGQEQHETETGLLVDKDVILFKTYFHLQDPYEEMSPVLFPKGFTRDFLDGKVSHKDLTAKIEQAHANISRRHTLTVIEGTGHTGVGSIVDLNNAQVASLLNVKIILVAQGGLGSSFDELALNVEMCRRYNVSVAGVILNRVLDKKRDMILEYMSKALKRWDIPILGAIPYAPFLSMPTMQDFEYLFQTKLLSGTTHLMRHFDDIRLGAQTVEFYRSTIGTNQLLITPAAREEIILATLNFYWEHKIAHPEIALSMGMILTGKEPPRKALIEEINRADIPMLYVPTSSFFAMKMINSFTAKIRKEDHAKIREAIQVVEQHIDFKILFKSVK